MISGSESASLLADSPKQYIFHCSRDGDEEIYVRGNDKPLWIFRTKHQHDLSLPELSFSDTSGRELLTAKCARRYLPTIFVIAVNGVPICTVKQQSIFLNKYSLEFNSGVKWTFYMPLFSVQYKGTSAAGDEVRVRMVRHDTWQVEIDQNVDNLHLVAALSLIHRERKRFS